MKEVRGSTLFRIGAGVLLTLCFACRPGRGDAEDTERGSQNVVAIYVTRSIAECAECKRIEVAIATTHPTSSALFIPETPDISVEAKDVAAVSPIRHDDRPSSARWSVEIDLEPNAAGALNQVVKDLGGSRIGVISIAGMYRETYLTGEDTSLTLSDFSSLEEIKKALAGYPFVPDEAVGTAETHAATRDPAVDEADRSIERSHAFFRESERIRKLYDDGTIDHDEMVRQLIRAQRTLLGNAKSESVPHEDGVVP